VAARRKVKAPSTLSRGAAAGANSKASLQGRIRNSRNRRHKPRTIHCPARISWSAIGSVGHLRLPAEPPTTESIQHPFTLHCLGLGFKHSRATISSFSRRAGTHSCPACFLEIHARKTVQICFCQKPEFQSPNSMRSHRHPSTVITPSPLTVIKVFASGPHATAVAGTAVLMTSDHDFDVLVY
jgi:hypothetical protein